MEGLKRTIGYIKPKWEANKPEITNKPEIPVTPCPAHADISETEKIKKWLSDHPAFKWSTMCGDLKIDKGNFCKVLKSSALNLPDKTILSVKKYISDYGYK